MSVFSDIDASGHAESLLKYLDDTDVSMSALKAYIVAAARRYEPAGPILDLGCGVGHDLARLKSAGVTAVGLDPSINALLRARALHPQLVQGDGARLPFRNACLGGCRIERVLQHVQNPGEVLDDVIRVVKPGGFVAILEPDHTSLQVMTQLPIEPTILGQWVAARHAAIGSTLAALLVERGCHVDDVVTETSFGYAIDKIPVLARAVLTRAVEAGALSPVRRDEWLQEQERRSKDGLFQASWTKYLVIARTPGADRAAGGRATATLSR